VLSPRPFLAELLDDTSRVTDIHLVLSPGLVLVTAAMSDDGRPRQRLVAGAEGGAARSD
jgi:hypothetical protein